MSNDYKVSIIIPVYNGEDYVKDAIDSALNQTYKNIEIIVVNDGSTDNTEELCLSYGNKIKYFYKDNGGVASALNYGILHSTGEYISWLSHDDVYLNNKIEKELDEVKKNNEESIIVCNVILTDFKLKNKEKHYIPEYFVINPMGFMALNLETGINGCALLIPRILFERNGLFDERLKGTQDYDMWWRFAKNEKFVLVNDHLVYSRQHAMQGSKTMKSISTEVDMLHSRFLKEIPDKLFKEYIDKEEVDAEEIFLLLKNNMSAPLSAVWFLYKYYSIYKDNDILNKFIFMNNNNSLTFNSSKKNTLLVYNNCYVIGGLERVISTLINRFCSEYNIIFVTKNYEKEKSFKISSDVKILSLDNDINDNLKCSLMFFCLYYNVDIFIGTQNLDEYLLNSYKYIKLCGVKVISSNHYDYFLPMEVPWLNSIISKRNTVSEYIDLFVWKNKQSAYLSNLNLGESVYIPNPVSFNTAKNVNNNSSDILVVGRLNDELKRLDLSFKVFSKLVKLNTNLKLNVIGNIDINERLQILNNKTCIEYLEELNIPISSVNFKGYGNNIESSYENNAILLLTSKSEGFGMVILEAFSKGIPVVSFDISGVSDLINNGVNGYLVQDNDIEEMVSVINEILNEPKKLEEMKINAIKSVNNYSLDKITDKWNQVFKSLLSEKEIKNDYNYEINYDKIIKKYDSVIVNTKNVKGIEIINNSLLKRLYINIKVNGVFKTLKKIISKVVHRRNK